jgi:hypothetical protein
MNRVRFYTEGKIDLYMKQGYFFKRCQFASEAEEKEFFATQEQLQRKLEKTLKATYGADIFVSDHRWPNESLKIEMAQQTLSPQLMAANLIFLKEEAPSYCIVSAVYRDLEVIGSPYLGRILISEREISVEESLKEIFKEKCLNLVTGNGRHNVHDPRNN